MSANTAKKPPRRPHYGVRKQAALPPRIRVLFLAALVVAAGYILRLAYLQVARHGFYEALASGQRELYQDLFPERGSIYVHDADGSEVPLVTNRYLNLIWAEPRRIDDPVRTATVLYDLLGWDEQEQQEAQAREEALAEARRAAEAAEESGEAAAPVEVPEPQEVSRLESLIAMLSKEDDPYEPVERKVPDALADEIARADLDGIHQLRERFRFYPEGQSAGHITGFVSPNDEEVFVGRYGLEGYFEELLSGTTGYLYSELDTKGRWISVGKRNSRPAEDGADLLLTVDRTVQFQICDLLAQAVERYEADRGSVVVMQPKTGAVLAMCTAPSFDPNVYNEVESIATYNNQNVFEAYEPGSVFKPLVMAGAIDIGAITPNTIYEDTGEVKIDQFTIRNSDLKANGWQNMTEVLEKSLNTGMIFVMRQMGRDQLARYVRAFGFGEATGVRLDTEVAGDVSSLDRPGEIYPATNSYGQGLTATTMQLAAAYSAIANGGTLMQPYIVEEIRRPDGTVERTEPEEIRRVLSSRTAQTVGAMLVSVVEHGHATTAGVPGYYIGGKTGTAQVARESGVGYKTDETIASFVGFGPVSDPEFVIVVRIDHPRTTPWASSTAAPTFGEMARFLLQYYSIPPDR